jgi:hypothetical protein
MTIIATERVKSGRPDDTKLPIPELRIEGLSKWRGIKRLLFRRPKSFIGAGDIASGFQRGKGFMYFDGVERRRHQRRPHADNIEFCLIPSDLTTILRGISIDISDSGMCLYTFTPMNTGQNILIKNFLPVPYQKATIRWVKKHTEGLYRVGLLLIEP